MSLENKIDELTSLVRALDTKLGFMQQDIDEMKEHIETLSATIEMEAAQKQAVADQKRYKVEKF